MQTQFCLYSVNCENVLLVAIITLHILLSVNILKAIVLLWNDLFA